MQARRGAIPASLQVVSVLLAGVAGTSDAHAALRRLGTLRHPIIDSRLTRRQALDGVDPTCPASIKKRQRLVTVRYLSTDGSIHQGQLVIDAELVPDILKVFALARKTRFPIASVIPMADRRFRLGDRWDDGLSMEANNTSAFNYRPMVGGERLSNHALGRALDVNPRLNPYVAGGRVLPRGSSYDPRVAGTLTKKSPLVRELVRLGWSWGGDWTSPKDYQHFEKPRIVGNTHGWELSLPPWSPHE